MIDYFLSFKFNALDYIILLTLIVASIKGFLTGGVDKVLKITGVVLSLYIVINYSGNITNFIMNQFNIKHKIVTMGIVIFLCCSIILSAFHFLAIKTTALFKILGINILNRLIGAMLGFLITIIIWSGLFILLGKAINTSPTILKQSVIKNLIINQKIANYDIKIIPEKFKKDPAQLIPNDIKQNTIKIN